MSERLITNLQELLAVSAKPLPNIPVFSEELHKSKAEIVERRKNLLNNLLGTIGNDEIWNLLFHASAITSGYEEGLERALLKSSRTSTPESAILVSPFRGKSLTLIKSDHGAEWGEEEATRFPIRQNTRMGLNFPRASDEWLDILCNDGESFEEVLRSLAQLFKEAALIPAQTESLAGDKAAAISENRKEIDRLTNLAQSLEAAIIPYQPPA